MQSLTIIAEVADGIGMFGFAVAGLFASAGRRIDPVGVFVEIRHLARKVRTLYR